MFWPIFPKYLPQKLTKIDYRDKVYLREMLIKYLNEHANPLFQLTNAWILTVSSGALASARVSQDQEASYGNFYSVSVAFSSLYIIKWHGLFVIH